MRRCIAIGSPCTSMHDPQPTYPASSGTRDAARATRFFFNDPAATALPPLESPFSEELLKLVPQGHPLREHALRYSRDGYTVIDLAGPELDATIAKIERDLAPRYPAGNRRVQEAWMFQPEVRALACHPRILELLAFLYQRQPIPFQTLNFDLGTEQAAHSDSLHFYSWPRRYMCGVWIAFEDMDGENGPLQYYPGSHRLPDYDLTDLGMQRGFVDYARYEEFIAALAAVHRFERRELHVKKGTALVWSANLLHGGSPVKDGRRTRHSQVTHYFFEKCTWWWPGGSDLIAGRPFLREVIDLGRGCFVTPTSHGEPLDLAKFEQVWRYPRPLPDWVQPAAS